MTIIACFFMVSCGWKSQNNNGPKPYTPPEIPAIMTDPQERADYLAGRWWDRFDFTDTAYIHVPQITEQAFSDYLSILPHVSPPAILSSMTNVLDKAQVNPQMFAYFKGLFEKYLYDPNSPMRNEELYIGVLEHLIDSPNIDELDKVQLKYQLEMISLNRPGTIATDFVYTLATGRQERMHQIKSEFLLIFFNNPGCTSCGEMQKGFEQSPVFKEIIEKGRLKILAMYADEDIASWEEHRISIPAHWINGYDAFHTLRNEKLYDLRAIPNLYLLDKDKRVIFRDATPYQVEEFLYYSLQPN